MTRTLLALLLTLLAAPALAQGAHAIGFTQDGTLFVIGHVSYDKVERYTVYDVRTGEPLEEEDLSPEQYEAWRAQHPLAPLKTGPRSPQGKLEVRVSGKGGSWKAGRFVVPGVSPWTGADGPEVKVPPPSKLRFSIKEGGKSAPGADFTFEHFNVDHQVEPIWSPEGRRVAFLVHQVSATDRQDLGYALAFGPTRGPRVQVLGVKGTAPEAYTQAQVALERAGLTPLATGEARSAHPTTVIFAAKGFEAEAKKAAGALPGARVDRLTWKPGYELVVVLGGP